MSEELFGYQCGTGGGDDVKKAHITTSQLKPCTRGVLVDDNQLPKSILKRSRLTWVDAVTDISIDNLALSNKSDFWWRGGELSGPSTLSELEEMDEKCPQTPPQLQARPVSKYRLVDRPDPSQQHPVTPPPPGLCSRPIASSDQNPHVVQQPAEENQGWQAARSWQEHPPDPLLSHKLPWQNQAQWARASSWSQPDEAKHGETAPLIGEKAEVENHIMDLRRGVRGGRAKILVGSAVVGTVRSDRRSSLLADVPSIDH